MKYSSLSLCKWLMCLLLLVACEQAKETGGQTAVASQPTITTTPTTIQEMATSAPTPTHTATPTSHPTSTQTPQPTAQATLTPPPTTTPDLYSQYTINTLSQRTFGGGQLEIIETLERTDTFTRYLIKYPSQGLEIYGFMSVPHEGDNFPIALVLHGYIPPNEYETVPYTKRYADSLVEAGYFVIHPNFRNYPPSDSGENQFRIGYAEDILDLIAIIQTQSQDDFGVLRRASANNIHLWGHSMGGGVALRVATVNNADYIRAIVLYGSMSGNEAWNFEQIQAWSGGVRGQFEIQAEEEMLAQISAINYLDRLNAPVSIHHSVDDEIVPVAWSDDLCQRLQAIHHPVECHTYYLQPHTFRGNADDLFMERVIDFFKRY